jgi:Transglutaminase-like superfamily
MQDFYAHPGPMTSAGAHDLTRTPGHPADVARMIQGLVIHEFMAPAYGVSVSPARSAESHIRHVDAMLDRIFALDPSPLTVARPPEQRLVGVCHHFSLLFAAIMRTHGVPVRYRQGFGTYFNAPYVEEHVVAEYWNTDASRWIMVDPQLDDVWCGQLALDFDPLDVPRDRFIVAGDAWRHCRSGRADPAHFGIFRGNLRGLWFIAGEMVRDLSALNAIELLPWDVWGAMPPPGESLDARLPYFDQLAELTLSDALPEIRSRFETDAGLRVPSTVFNAVLNRPETVGGVGRVGVHRDV